MHHRRGVTRAWTLNFSFPEIVQYVGKRIQISIDCVVVVAASAAVVVVARGGGHTAIDKRQYQ